MKYRILFIVAVLWPVTLGTHPAIIVLYYPQESTYKYADLKQLQELRLQSNNESQFTDILLYCPPETEDEKVSAAMANVDLMFVRKTVQMESDIGDINICADHYKAAVWQSSNTYTDLYRFGYLVSEHEISMKNQNLDRFVDKWKREFRGVILFPIEYEARYAAAVFSEHTMTATKRTTDSFKFCENDMSMGLEILKLQNESTFVNAYKRENQKRNLNYEYDSRHYFVMKQLIPVDDFDDNGRKLATCSYMNTYPVWNLVHKALIDVENYLRKILELSLFVKSLYIQTRLIDKLYLPERPTTPPITKNEKDSSQAVSSSVIKMLVRTLHLPVRSKYAKYAKDAKDTTDATDATDSSPVSSPIKVYLDADNKKIPVPARILKIIGHRVPLPRKQDRDSNKPVYKYYFMAIVFENTMTWNGRYYKSCKKLLNCGEYGWDVAEWEWGDSQSYCCQLAHVFLHEEALYLRAIDEEYEILDLKNVVIEFDEEGAPQYENIAGLINREKKGLKEGSD